MFNDRPGGRVVVYVIRRSDTLEIKIGRAIDVQKRLATLQCAHGEPLSLVVWFRGVCEDERELHRYFGAYRKLGEWFRECPKINDWIERQRLHNLAQRGSE